MAVAKYSRATRTFGTLAISAALVACVMPKYDRVESLGNADAGVGAVVGNNTGRSSGNSGGVIGSFNSTTRNDSTPRGGDGGRTVSGGDSGGAGGGAAVQGGSNAQGVGGHTAASQGGDVNLGGSSAVESANGGNAVSTGGRLPTLGGATSSGATTNDPGGGNSSGGAQPNNGGAATGGAPPNNGGAATGGRATGGVATGGRATGGAATGGSSTTLPVANYQCGIPAAGATGKPKPSGAAGNLKVLDWAGFKSAISYTFDDSNSSQIANYAAMNDTGGKFTFYMWTAKSEASNAIWRTALQDGHELGNHSSNHSTSQTTAEAAQSFIQSNFSVVAYAYAAPNGTTVSAGVTNMFLSVRSVSGGSVGPGATSSLSWLPADLASASNLAPIAGKWRIICIHGFSGGTDDAYQPIELSSFTTAAGSAVAGGSWVDTVTNIAAYQWGQNAMKAGGTKVTWNKPSVFPPNKCVRATVDGGTVIQKGVAVPWNDHGYYEISLDAGEVTVE